MLLDGHRQGWHRTMPEGFDQPGNPADRVVPGVEGGRQHQPLAGVVRRRRPGCPGDGDPQTRAVPARGRSTGSRTLPVTSATGLPTSLASLRPHLDRSGGRIGGQDGASTAQRSSRRACACGGTRCCPASSSSRSGTPTTTEHCAWSTTRTAAGGCTASSIPHRRPLPGRRLSPRGPSADHRPAPSPHATPPALTGTTSLADTVDPVRPVPRPHPRPRPPRAHPAARDGRSLGSRGWLPPQQQ